MIRKCQISDIPRCIELAEAHLSASSYAALSYNQAKTTDFLEDLINENGFAVVIERDGLIVGGMIGDVINPWFSDSKVGIEHIIYVDPAYRIGRDVYRLIRSWVEWCKAQGCEQIRPQITSGNVRVARLYEAMGFKPCGYNFVM